MQKRIDDIEFEHVPAGRRLIKRCIVEPMVNYVLPADFLRWLLRVTKSELAQANWQDPGGWLSMVISYDGRPKQWADKLLVNGGSISMALRNRKRLASEVLADLIDRSTSSPAEVLCVGAGPGLVIMDALERLKRDDVRATLVDLSDDAHDYARRVAAQRGLDKFLHFVSGDIRTMNLAGLLNNKLDVVKMIGICEYLEDDRLVEISRVIWSAMPPGGSVVLNSLSYAHGTARFLRKVFGLHMIHRTPEQLEALMTRAGFGDFSRWSEPLDVYHVIVARRKESC